MKEEKEKVQQGKNPFYFKRGLIKIMAMKAKIEEMKEKGEYKEYARKKRKREKTEERASMNAIPHKRRE